MKNITISVLIIVIGFSNKAYLQSNFIENITDKTWFFEDDFSGSSITIYKTLNGNFKAILQQNGSGRPITSSELYDVKTDKNNLLLYNGIDLNLLKAVTDKSFEYDKLNNQLRFKKYIGNPHFKEVVIWSWLEKVSIDQIDFEKLIQIGLAKGMVYSKEQISNVILIE